MVIEVNTDIQNYKETVFLGLTAKQLIFSVVSLVAGGGVVLLAYPYTGLTAGAYIAVPVAAPIALSGFYSYNGMGFIEMVKLKLHFAFKNRTLLYVSTENADEIIKMQQEAIQEEPGREKPVAIKTGSQKIHRKKRCVKVIKHMVIFLAVSVMAVLAVVFYLWEQYGYTPYDTWMLLKGYIFYF